MGGRGSGKYKKNVAPYKRKRAIELKNRKSKQDVPDIKKDALPVDK